MPENMHFYASSVCQWVTTTQVRDLRQLIKHMERDGFNYNLFLVPVAHDAKYEIKMYQPQVEGTQWLGYYEVKEETKAKAKRK
jgi:hypothetical protein